MCQSPITAIITRPLITAKRFRTQHSEYYTLDIICLAPGADGPCPSKKKCPKLAGTLVQLFFSLQVIDCILYLQVNDFILQVERKIRTETKFTSEIRIQFSSSPTPLYPCDKAVAFHISMTTPQYALNPYNCTHYSL